MIMSDLLYSHNFWKLSIFSAALCSMIDRYISAILQSFLNTDNNRVCVC